MKEKCSLLLGLICGLLLCSLGSYRIFTDQLEEMSLTVGYIFAIAGFISFAFSSIGLFNTAKS
ncbi:hypothetical protein UACE39S_02275 [Ureibacillus acetophenoni]